MGYFVDGQWKSGWYPSDKDGGFVRPPTTYRGKKLELEQGRYHLYASWACPWAHRLLIARSILGLEDKISVSYLDWLLDDDGWRFNPERPGSTVDHIHQRPWLRDLYKLADHNYTGRVTVPLLWDCKTDTIINNESRELLRLFTTTLHPWHKVDAPDLAPANLLDDIEAMLDEIYEPINNGVYKAGFAKSQSAYDQAISTLFAALDRLDTHLSKHRFLVGDVLTEADICCFTTLFRFDPVYYVHFKCSRQMISEYPNLDPYLKRIYALPGVAATCRLDHIISHYYLSHRGINPHGLIASMPKAFASSFADSAG